MTEDWAAVAAAISERMTQLGLRQRVLAERAHVSQAIVKELQHNTAQRRRSARTLEALSIALGWHPRYLAAVSRGEQTPRIGDPINDGDEVATRLGAIESQLREITERIDEMNTNLWKVIGHEE